MHILFNLLRIKGLYMFRKLLAHPQEALHKRHLVYCVLVMSVGCTRIGVELVSQEQLYKRYLVYCVRVMLAATRIGVELRTPVPLKSW
jgi:hypothetical protein